MNLHLDTTQIVGWAEQHTALAVAAPVGAVAGLALLWVVLTRSTRGLRRRLAVADTADQLTIVAAAVATIVTATGMWQVFEDRMPLPMELRIPVFAFIELATVTSAVRARKNIRTRPDQRAGVDGIAVWAFTALTAFLSALDAHSFVEALIRLSAPVVAAWLWERGMHVERARITGVRRGTIHWRLTPERILVRLGLAEPTARDAGALAAERRLTALAVSAARAHTLRMTEASGVRQAWAVRRVQKAMRAAVTHTDLTRDSSQQTYVLEQYAALVHATALTTLDRRPTWLAEPPAAESVTVAVQELPSPIVPADPDQIARLRDALRGAPADSADHAQPPAESAGHALNPLAETATPAEAADASGDGLSLTEPEQSGSGGGGATRHDVDGAETADELGGAAAEVAKPSPYRLPDEDSEPPAREPSLAESEREAAREAAMRDWSGKRDATWFRALEAVSIDPRDPLGVPEPILKLAKAIDAGELPPTASAEAIRRHLDIPRAEARQARQWARLALPQQAAQLLTGGQHPEPLNNH